MIGVPVLLSIISFYLKSKYPIDEKKMSALTKTIVFQNLKIKEIKDNVNFYLIKNPVYGNEQIQIIPKTEVEKNTMFVAEHFLNEDYLQKLSKGDFKGVYKQKLFILIIWFAVLAVFSFVLGMTFKYLEITSLNLFPLFSLIIVTISISAIVINLIQLRVIYKCMKGDYEIDLDFMKLILYKMQNEVVDASNKNEGLIAEFVNLFHECKKNNN